MNGSLRHNKQRSVPCYRRPRARFASPQQTESGALLQTSPREVRYATNRERCPATDVPLNGSLRHNTRRAVSGIAGCLLRVSEPSSGERVADKPHSSVTRLMAGGEGPGDRDTHPVHPVPVCGGVGPDQSRGTGSFELRRPLILFYRGCTRSVSESPPCLPVDGRGQGKTKGCLRH